MTRTRHRHLITAVTVLVVAITVGAGALGWAVYRTSLTEATAQRAGWQTVTAIATESATLPTDGHRMTWTVPACWPTPTGGRHCDTVTTDHAVEAGQTVLVWIDRQGRYQDLTDPSARAQRDGFIAALLLWASLIGALSATVAVWRRHRAARDLDAALAALLT